MEDPIHQVMWSFDHVVAWKIKKFLSAFQQHLWQPNLAEQRLRMGDTIPQVTWTFNQVVTWSLFVRCIYSICCYHLENNKFIVCSITFSRLQNNFDTILFSFQKQPSIDVLRKMCSENMQEISEKLLLGTPLQGYF